MISDVELDPYSLRRGKRQLYDLRRLAANVPSYVYEHYPGFVSSNKSPVSCIARYGNILKTPDFFAFIIRESSYGRKKPYIGKAIGAATIICRQHVVISSNLKSTKNDQHLNLLVDESKVIPQKRHMLASDIDFWTLNPDPGATVNMMAAKKLLFESVRIQQTKYKMDLPSSICVVHTNEANIPKSTLGLNANEIIEVNNGKDIFLQHYDDDRFNIINTSIPSTLYIHNSQTFTL